MKTTLEVIEEADHMSAGFNVGEFVMMKSGAFGGLRPYRGFGHPFRITSVLQLKDGIESGLIPVGIVLRREFGGKTQILVRPLADWMHTGIVVHLLAEVSRTATEHEVQNQTAPVGHGGERDNSAP